MRILGRRLTTRRWRCCPRLKAETVYILLELLGLTLGFGASLGELVQWYGTEDASAPAGAASKRDAQNLPWADWYGLWLFAIITDGLGMIVLIAVTAIHGFGGPHYDGEEYRAMQLLWVSTFAQTLAALIYQPLYLKDLHVWPRLLFHTRRYSWLLSNLVDLGGLTSLVLGYEESLSRRMLGFDFWGLLMLVVGALLELLVSNPHHHHKIPVVYNSMHETGASWMEYDWLASWHRDGHFHGGWEASAYLEASGMSILILAEIYEHMSVHMHSVGDTMLTILCCPPKLTMDLHELPRVSHDTNRSPSSKSSFEKAKSKLSEQPDNQRLVGSRGRLGRRLNSNQFGLVTSPRESSDQNSWELDPLCAEDTELEPLRPKN